MSDTNVTISTTYNYLYVDVNMLAIVAIISTKYLSINQNIGHNYIF